MRFFSPLRVGSALMGTVFLGSPATSAPVHTSVRTVSIAGFDYGPRYDDHSVYVEDFEGIVNVPPGERFSITIRIKNTRTGHQFHVHATAHKRPSEKRFETSPLLTLQNNTTPKPAPEGVWYWSSEIPFSVIFPCDPDWPPGLYTANFEATPILDVGSHKSIQAKPIAFPVGCIVVPAQQEPIRVSPKLT
jgi:hypothetical protein